MTNAPIAQGIIEFGGDASGVTAAAAEVGKSLDQIGSKVKQLGNESGDGFKKVEDGAKGAAKATQTWNEYLKENITEARKQFASQDLSKAEAYSASVKKVAESWREMQRARQSASSPIPLGAGDVDALTKAQDRLLNSIARQATVVTEGKAKWLELRAAQAGISEQATPYIAKLKSIEKSTSELGISQGQLTAAMRGVPAQFTDIVTSLQGGQAPLTVFLQQGGQLKDMFGGAGNAARALSGYILGLVNPFTIAAGAAVALGVAYNQGSKEAQQFANALITTGNAAGTTKNQLMDMARTISESGISTQGAAAEALSALVSTGKVGVDNLQKFASVAVQAQKVVGTSIQDTAKDFAELGKAPLQASVKLDEQYNFLTVSIYKQIKALQDQGKTVEAAKLAQNTYADALAERTAGIEQNLGSIERGWLGVKNFAKSAWDEMLGIGRETTESERINQLQTNIKNRLDFIARERPQSLLIPKAKNDNAKDQQELDLLLKKTDQQKIQADLKAKENAAKNAGLEFDRQGDEFLTKKAKLTNEIAKATNTYLKSIESDPRSNAEKEKDIALTTRLAQIKDKYKETVSKEESAYKSLSRTISEKLALSQLELNSEKPLTESQKLRVKMLELLEGAQTKKQKQDVLSLGTNIDMIRSNELMKQSYEGLRKEIEKFKPKLMADDVVAGIAKQDKAYSDLVVTQQQYRQSLQDNADLMQLESSLAGQSATDRNTAIEQYKIEIALKKELLKIEQDINLTQAQKDERSDVARENANIAKSQAALKAQQGEWSKFYQDIYSGLTDSLYRGFEAGKGFFQSFWDGIKNLFKTTVLKLAVQGVVTGTLGSLGISQAGAAQANQLGNAVSLFEAGKSIWNGFSAAGTIGGGIGQLGSLFGSSSISAFASGMSGTAAGTFAGMGPTLAGSSTGLGALAGTGGTTGVLSTGAGTGVTAVGAGSSAAAAIPIVGWVLAGMMANNSLFDKGWGEKLDDKAKYSGAAAGMVGGLFTDSIQRIFGLSDKTASMLSGSAVVNRLFGNKRAELQQSELSGSFGVGGYSANQRDVFKAEGGLFSGDKWSEKNNAVSDTKAMSDMFMSIKSAAAGYASQLGLSSKELETFSKSFKFNLSITGDAAKDAEANQKLINDLFVGITNDITNLLAPSISAFGKEGETASQTLQRLATSLTGINSVMKAVGFAEFSKSLEGASAAERLAELTGGIEKLATGAQYFFENFLSDAEKLKPSSDLVTATMARLGQSAVDTIPEFKTLVQGLDLASESGAKMYAELIAIAPQFKAIADSKAAEEMQKLSEATRELELASQKAKAIADERKSLQDEYNSLTMSSAELFAQYKNSLDVSNQSLAESIQAIKDKTAAEEAAAAKAASIVAERKTLQDEYNSLTMTAVQLMAQYRNGLDASNQSLFDQINVIKEAREKALAEEKAAAEALASAQKEASDIAAERATLQDEYNRLTMTEIELMGLKRATLKESNRDLFDLINAEKARREESAKAEAALKASESEWAQSMKAAFDSQTGALKNIISEFGTLAKTLQDYSRSLTVGTAAKLSPEARYKLLGEEINVLMPQVKAGDKNALAKWAQVSEEYLKASEGYNATSVSYFKDLELIKTYTDEAAQYAQSQVDVAQLQLNAMTNSVDAINGVNQSVQQVLQAITGAASGSGSSGAEMGLVSGYQANVLRNVENLGGLENLYQGAISGNPDAYRNLKGQMQRWAQMGLDKNALDTILGAGWYDKLKAIPGFANGGVASGLAMVGERGPELVNFKSPSRVYNANDTQSIIGGSNSKETNDLLREQNRLLRQILTQTNSNDKAAVQTLKSVDNRLSGMQTNANFEKASTS